MKQLHVVTGSPNCRKVLAVIAELELDVEIVSLDLSTVEHKSPAYLEINPNGRVPALVDGELKLWESHAIMQYLCDSHGETELFPTDTKRRADVVRWQCWDLAHFGNHLSVALFERVFKPFAGIGAPDEDVTQRAIEAFTPLAAVLDRHLGERPYVCGDRVTLADFSLAAQLELVPFGRIDFDPYPHLRAWMGRLDERPAWRETAMPAAMVEVVRARIEASAA